MACSEASVRTRFGVHHDLTLGVNSSLLFGLVVAVLLLGAAYFLVPQQVPSSTVSMLIKAVEEADLETLDAVAAEPWVGAHIEGFGHTVLQWGRSTDINEIGNESHLFNYVQGSHSITQAPSGHVVGFRESA